ncbi:MAG TPA: VanZ family protein [Trueperaceae bacterium]
MDRIFARRSLLWRLAPLAWMALVFILSNQPDIAEPFEIPDWLPADKLVHAGLYAVLAALLYLAGLGPVASVVVTALYGVTDEIHQMFVPGRNPELLDLLADLVGAVAGVWLVQRWSGEGER